MVMPDAPGPATSALLVNPYYRNARVCWLLVPLSLLVGGVATAAVLALVEDSALAVIPVLVGATALFVLLICAVVFQCYAPRIERHLEELRQGRYLARWSYTAEEWRRFAESEKRGGHEGAGLAGLIVAALGMALGALAWLAGGQGLVGLVLAGAFAGLGALIYGLARLSSRLSYNRARRGPSDTWIGAHGAYVNHAYHTWATWGWGLQSIVLVEGRPAVLELTIGLQHQNYTLRVLVPEGREDEAREVVTAFR
jgi:hypothetical protein